MTPNLQLMAEDGKLFEVPEKYRRLVGKLNYLIVTRSDITYLVSVVYQFMLSPIVVHWEALRQILCYLKRTLVYDLFYSNYEHSNIECFSDVDWASLKVDK